VTDAGAELLPEGAVLVVVRHVQALAALVELEAVVAAADSVLLDHPVGHGGAAVRALLGDDAVPAVQHAVDDELLAEEPNPLGPVLLQLADHRDGIPVVAKHLAHRRPGTHAGHLLIDRFRQHRSTSIPTFDLRTVPTR
jgi:hypothetical protein